MKNKIYTIKERIKEIAVNKGIPLGKYFEDLEISYTGFSGEKLKIGVNSDVIQKIIYKYPDVDLQWLITGKESKKAEKENNSLNESPESYGESYKDKYIKVLEENKILQEKIIGLLEANNSLKKYSH